MYNTSIAQDEYNVEFPTTNQEGEESIEIYDLNKIFQMNFSYNFDILKNLIEALMKNQKNFQNELKEKNTKILDLESQLLDLKLSFDSGESKNIEKTQSKPESLPINDNNPKLFSVIKGNQDVLRPPPNNINLEVSIGNDDNINKIIVSNILYNI